MLNLRQHHWIARETVSATCDEQGDSVRQVEVDERGALRTARGSATDAIAIAQGYCNANQCEYNAMGLRCNAMRSQCEAEATRLQREHMLLHPDRNALQDNFDCSAVAMQWNGMLLQCVAKQCDASIAMQRDAIAMRCCKYLQPNGYAMQKQWADTNSSTT